jgi:fumarate reductase subunit C
MKQEFLSWCQMFLIPMAIFFAALAVAKTQAMKTGISLVAFVISLVSGVRLLGAGATDLSPRDLHTASGLAVIIILVWLIAALVHAGWWYQEPDFPSVPKTP